MSSRGRLIRPATARKENAAAARTSEGKGFDHRRALGEISDNHPKKSIQKKNWPIFEDARKSKKNVQSKTIQSVSCQTEGCNMDEISSQTDESFLGMQASYKEKYENADNYRWSLEEDMKESNNMIQDLLNEVDLLKNRDPEHADCHMKREYEALKAEYAEFNTTFDAVVAVLKDTHEENQNLKKQLELLRPPSTKNTGPQDAEKEVAS